MPKLSRRRTPDFVAEGMLRGLRGRKRAARLELLEHLHRQGVPLAELKQAIAEDRLALLPAERVLADKKKYTAAQVAKRSGIELDLFADQRRAAGLPVAPEDEVAYSDADVQAARRLKQGLEAGLDRDAMLEGARAFGQAASQAAAASRALVGESFIRPGDTEHDVGLRIAEAARRLQPQTVKTLQYLYETHLREQVRSDMVAGADLAAGTITGTRQVAVCFADLVGFTKLGEQVGPEDLGAVASRFRVLASEVARPPVSLIKMIGDAAMLVSPEPEPLLEAALSLVEETDREDLPQLKAGVALGEALNRWGDWYGAPVNLASRVTEVALPASVLASTEVRDATADNFSWSFAGRHKLKGLRGELDLYRCRPGNLSREGSPNERTN
jgi:adenylate cyclase